LLGPGDIFFRAVFFLLLAVLFGDAVLTHGKEKTIRLSQLVAVLFGGAVLPYFLLAIVRLKLHNVRSGANIERTFSASEKFRQVELERRHVQFLYRDGDLFYFMDVNTFDNIVVGLPQMGNAPSYIKEGDVVDLMMFGEEPIDLQMPVTVELAVTETDPGYKGDTATGANKPATVETAAGTLRDLRVAEIVKLDMTVENGKVGAYRARVLVSFKYRS
jgi:elongation factor P